MKKSTSYMLVNKVTGEIIAVGNSKEMKKMRKNTDGNSVYFNVNNQVGDFITVNK